MLSIAIYINFMSEERNEQQWIVVKSKKKKFIEKQIKLDRIHNKGAKLHLQTSKIEEIIQDFGESQSFKYNLALFHKMFEADSCKIQVNCLGLGNFLTEFKPFLQWLFLKKVILQDIKERKCTFKLNIFDPVFSKEQKEEITNLKSTSLQLCKINKDFVQVVYMPHCERNLHQLVCSLKMNHPQTKFLVIGNSISQYKSRSKLLQQPIHQSFLEVCSPQYKIKDYKQAFNDMFMYKL